MNPWSDEALASYAQAISSRRLQWESHDLLKDFLQYKCIDAPKGCYGLRYSQRRCYAENKLVKYKACKRIDQ